MRNRTADLLLTMETLYRLSYRGQRGINLHDPGAAAKSGCLPEKQALLHMLRPRINPIWGLVAGVGFEPT